MQQEQQKTKYNLIYNNSGKIALSLCIPRVAPSVYKKDIYDIFNRLNIGEISRVDLIERQTANGEKFKRVFVHFKTWYNNEKANQMKERFDSGKDVKLVYDDPWFWKLSVSKSVAASTA